MSCESPIVITEETYNYIKHDLECVSGLTQIYTLVQIVLFAIFLIFLIYKIIRICIWCKQNNESMIFNKFNYVHLLLIICHIILVVIESNFFQHRDQIQTFLSQPCNDGKYRIDTQFYHFTATQNLLYYFLFFFFCASIVLACVYWFNIIFNISNIQILVQLLLGSLIFVFAFIYLVFMQQISNTLNPDSHYDKGVINSYIEFTFYFYHYTITGITSLIGIFFVVSIFKVRMSLEKLYMISLDYRRRLIFENWSIVGITLFKLIFNILCLSNVNNLVIVWLAGIENIVSYALNGYFLSYLFYPTRQKKIDILNTFEQNMEQEEEKNFMQNSNSQQRNDEISFISKKGEYKQA